MPDKDPDRVTRLQDDTMAYPQLSLLPAGYVQRLDDHGVAPMGTL